MAPPTLQFSCVIVLWCDLALGNMSGRICLKCSSKSSTVEPANHQKHLSSELTVPKSSRGKSSGLFSSLLQSTNATGSTCRTKSRPSSWPLSKHHYGLCYTILIINIKQCIYRYFNINIPEVIKLSVIKYSLAERVFIKSYLHLLLHGTTALT